MSLVGAAVGYFTLKESVIRDYEIRLQQDIALIAYNLGRADDLERYVAETAPLIGVRICTDLMPASTIFSALISSIRVPSA